MKPRPNPIITTGKMLPSAATFLPEYKIEKLRDTIKTTFFFFFYLIIKKFFDFEYSQITNLEQLENFRRKITSFDKYVGHAEEYTFFYDYLTETMNKLEHKSNMLENGGTETAPTVLAFSISDVFRKIKILLQKKVTD